MSAIEQPPVCTSAPRWLPKLPEAGVACAASGGGGAATRAHAPAPRSYRAVWASWSLMPHM